jgi:hypothetical protein
LPVSILRFHVGRDPGRPLRWCGGGRSAGFEPWQLRAEASRQVVVTEGRPLAPGEDPLARHPLPEPT